MRRIACVTAVLALSLAACSTGVSADPAASSTAGTATSSATSAAPRSEEPASPASPASTPSAEAPTGPPGFAIATERRRDVPRFQRFRYQTAVATGMSPEAGARVDAAVADLVGATVDRAVRKSEDPCLVGRGRCASFEATLTALPCRSGYLCLLQDVRALWPASAIPYRTADTLVFDAVTGEPVALTAVVPATRMTGFLASVRKAVDRFQRRNGIRADDLPERLAPADVQAWAPLRGGIRVWFDEYVAAPGFFGVVDVRVPYPPGA